MIPQALSGPAIQLVIVDIFSISSILKAWLNSHELNGTKI
jgi:hypothetical protein